MSAKILQLVSAAPGVVAVRLMVDPPHYEALPVICWALIERDDPQVDSGPRVEGLVADSINVESAEENYPAFGGYYQADIVADALRAGWASDGRAYAHYVHEREKQAA